MVRWGSVLFEEASKALMLLNQRDLGWIVRLPNWTNVRSVVKCVFLRIGGAAGDIGALSLTPWVEVLLQFRAWSG